MNCRWPWKLFWCDRKNVHWENLCKSYESVAVWLQIIIAPRLRDVTVIIYGFRPSFARCLPVQNILRLPQSEGRWLCRFKRLYLQRVWFLCASVAFVRPPLDCSACLYFLTDFFSDETKVWTCSHTVRTHAGYFVQKSPLSTRATTYVSPFGVLKRTKWVDQLTVRNGCVQQWQRTVYTAPGVLTEKKTQKNEPNSG